MRFQKYMAMCGVAARRKCEEIIASGRVAVNGETITQMGTQVEEGDVVTLDGQVITSEEEKRYILYHKPAGEVTTVSDDKGRETVMDRFADFPVRLYPVGRLDYDSEGLLLLTNDGELLHRLISPKKEVAKVYYARHEGQANADDISAFAAGLTLRDGTVCLPALLEPLGPGESRITVREGKYHQVRRMMASRNMTVTYLERRQEGTLTLGDLQRGRTRELTEGEIALLEGKTQP